MEYVADRRRHSKPNKTPRTPFFTRTLGRKDWPAFAARHALYNRAFANRWADEDESADLVRYAGEPVGRLRKLYEFRNEAAVEAFLEENPVLAQLLPRAYDKVREYFGSGARLVLKVSNDPEAREDQQLFVLIRTGLRPKAARALLFELGQGWWHGVFPATEGKMTIGLEYI